MLAAPDAVARARAYHTRVRERDAHFSTNITPVLSDRSLEPLPTSSMVTSVSRRICGNATPQTAGAMERKFMQYCQRGRPGCYAPLLPGSQNPPIPLSTLPGKVAVLDHLRAVIESQDPLSAGGSYMPFLQNTLEFLSDHRQPPAAWPASQKIVFGQSSDLEICSFIKDFNNTVRESASYTPGHLPHSFYHFDVEEISSCAEVGFTVHREGAEEVTISKSKTVARIHLGTHTRRFDIVIPWEPVHVSSNFQGTYVLRMGPGPISSHWFTLFSELAGVAIGIGVEEDVKTIKSFLHCFFPRERFGSLHLRRASLEVLLVLAGYNSTRTNISSLNFFFTGGLVVKPWEMRCGFGRWGDVSTLSHALSLYLQSEAVGVLNTALVCLCCLLVHLFPTPGIAAIVTRKPPSKFLEWFTAFWARIMGEFEIAPADQFSNSADRCDSPRRMIRRLIPFGSPSVDARDLAELLPPWRPVTGGGCPSDQLALEHLVRTAIPILRVASLPLHLRLSTDPSLITGFLTASRAPTGRDWTSRGLGCFPDPSQLPVTLSFAQSATGRFSVNTAVRQFKERLHPRHPQRTLSVAQLLLSYTWQNPAEAFEHWRLQARTGCMRFTNREFHLLKPVLTSYFPEAEEVTGSREQQQFCDRRLLRSRQFRLQRLLRARDMASEADRRQIERKIKRMQASILKLGLPTPTPRRAPEVSAPMEASATHSEVPAGHPDECSEEEEDRRIMIVETSESDEEIQEDELIISTSSWDCL